jgi:hypothetical protein
MMSSFLDHGGLWLFVLLWAFWPRRTRTRLPWLPYPLYRRVWPVYALVRVLGWLRTRQHVPMVRRARHGRVPQIVKDAERCARGDHPVHRVTAAIEDGHTVVDGDEWKGHKAKPPALLVDIRCAVCGTFTGHAFAIRDVPLDDRLGTDVLAKLANVTNRPQTIVLPDGSRHDMQPESTPDDACGLPAHLWAKRRP